MKTFEEHGIQVSGTGQQKTTCPTCSAGRKKPKDPCLSVNVESLAPDKGAWHCHHCDESGGLGEGNSDYKPPKSKTYKKPDFTFKPALEEEAYLFLVEERKIKPTVFQRNRICSQEGTILFPFYQNDECPDVGSNPPSVSRQMRADSNNKLNSFGSTFTFSLIAR